MAYKKPVPSLAQAIQGLSPELIDDCDAAEASRNLLGFFEVLMTIKREQQEKGNASCESLKPTSVLSNPATG
jgi:hypothetical protein